jgi:SM-20-related protein
MPRWDDVLLVRGFLDAETCTRLVGRYQVGEAATVTRADGRSMVDERSRKTLSIEADPESLNEVVTRLDALQATVQAHFRTTLGGHQNPHFLLYRPGDYFRAHLDNACDERQPEEIRSRRIAIVIFLNSQSATSYPGRYRGGELVFYDPDASSPERRRVLLRGEEGLLVAFAVNYVHEVLPVVHGNRYTIVTWYT